MIISICICCAVFVSVLLLIIVVIKDIKEELNDTTVKNKTWYCHKCGKNNDMDDLKCVECGADNKNILSNTASKSFKKSALNYTPLTKKEIDKKYPVVSQIDYAQFSANDTFVTPGIVAIERVMFSDEIVLQTSEKYFAFDVETTGLKADSDRIIEIGAVLFENGKPVKTFDSLVDPKIKIPYSATAVNHITNQMIRNAPTEEIVYPKLIEFLGNALDGQVIICAHNASFDMKFLSATLQRLGYNAKIMYLDTLSISRYMLPDLDNHKQPTVAKHLEIVNDNEHRAASDAEVCGKILSHFIDVKLIKIEEARIKEAERAEARRIKEEEKHLRQEAVQKAKEERERLKKIKEEEKQRKLIEKQNAEPVPKKPVGRSVIQMDDDFNIIKQYESVAEASRELGINAKSIRETAYGRQKHAGGYVWRYKDDFENKTEE